EEGLRCGVVYLRTSTEQLQTIEQGSKTLICISFTKLNIHLLLERVFPNFIWMFIDCYSTASKCYKETAQIPRKADLREDVLLTCRISSIHRYTGSTSLLCIRYKMPLKLRVCRAVWRKRSQARREYVSPGKPEVLIISRFTVRSRMLLRPKSLSHARLPRKSGRLPVRHQAEI
ncbi:hypothetical protein CSKR_112231, partial [Clonorchis sinensis]